MGAIKFSTNLMLLALFTLAIILFASSFFDDNDRTNLIKADSDYVVFNKSIQGNLSGLQTQQDSASDAFLSL